MHGLAHLSLGRHFAEIAQGKVADNGLDPAKEWGRFVVSHQVVVEHRLFLRNGKAVGKRGKCEALLQQDFIIYRKRTLSDQPMLEEDLEEVGANHREALHPQHLVLGGNATAKA